MIVHENNQVILIVYIYKLLLFFSILIFPLSQRGDNFTIEEIENEKADFSSLSQGARGA